MKKGRVTRIVAIGMVCSMAFLSACGKKNGVITEGGDRPAKEVDKDHVYSFENVDIPVDENSSISRVCAGKDSLYAVAYVYDPERMGTTKLFRMPFETGVLEELPIGDGSKGISIDNVACDDEGNLYAIKYEYNLMDEAEVIDAETYDEVAEAGGVEGSFVAENAEAADGEEAVDGESKKQADGDAAEADDDSKDQADGDAAEADGDSKDQAAGDETVADGSDDAASDSEESGDATELSEEELAEYESAIDDSTRLAKISPEGDVIWETTLTEEDADSYIRSMIYAKGIGVMTCSESGICVYDENNGDGKCISKREQKEGEYYDAYLFRMRNDDVYLFAEEDGSDTKISKLDQGNMTFSDVDVKLPEGVYGGYDLYPGAAYDFYSQESSGIFAFNLGDEKTTKICDFTASNEVVNMVNFMGEAPDGRIVLANSSGDETVLSLLSKVDPSAVEEKEIITLGTVYIADTVRKQVVKFNKSSDKYKINVVDYAEMAGEDPSDDDTSDEYMTGINMLSLDITQGKAPDIILVESSMPFESYASKGAIEPLDPYFEADEEISKDDYLANVLEAAKVKDHMYSIIPSFDITTCVVAKDNTAGEVVTLENYKDICNKCGIDPEVGMGMLSRSDARELYETIGSAYVNYEEGTCSFDSDSFIQLLEFIKELPENSEDMDYDTYEAYYRENKSLLKGYWLGSFQDYQVLKEGYFGKDIVFNGYPTTKDGRSYISPMVQIAMSSDCKNKQAVWEFMKSFLTDEYQNSLEWSFPVEKKAIDTMAKKAQEKPYYIDAQGKKVEHTSIWNIAGQEVEIGELTEEETQNVVEFIESVTNTQSRDDNVINIVEEEAAAFYEGQKSAEEVADIIQSRVSIYLSEQM